MLLMFSRLRAVSFFSESVERNAGDTKMTTRVPEGARRERHGKREATSAPRFLASRGLAVRRLRACELPLLLE